MAITKISSILISSLILLAFTGMAGCSQSEPANIEDQSKAANYDRQAAADAGYRPVSGTFAVSPQIQLTDLQTIADAGFTRVINHRPDNERPGQPLSADLAAEAERLGLKFIDLPFRPGNITPAVFDQLSAELAKSNEPTLAYCGSGTRAITIWALSEVKAGNQTPDQVIAAAKAAGYKLDRHRAAMEELQTSATEQ